MAQQFQVLRCCFCHIFQVQQVKKSKKWNCKICNEKQSVLKVFGQGSGSDCRHHVQTLNLLLGEREQAPVNMPWYTEEPEERENKNTVGQLEENLDWQEEKASRWNKYLDKSCEDEEKMLHTEKQTYSSFKNIAEDSRKHKKTSLDKTDAQRAKENRVPQFGSNPGRNSFKETQASENAVHGNMGILVVEELPVHGKNEDPGLRNSVISNWKTSFLSETFKESMVSTELEGQVSIVQSSSAAAASDKIANFIDSPPNWQHIPRQTACVFQDNIQKASERTEAANIPNEKNRDSSLLPSANLQRMLSKVPTTIPSVHPSAFSSATGRYSSLFSTGDDFDDYL
ncbi:MRN complex-interacting protein [Eublepharis macularius]|uniref:MRN complex-interacting protein n=1 Tax=Eublepharis macularius TaxID=481883 RepID=A0AA97KU56_EUBMA|nr:MRN complex-interacting protein [Eublepharis macularius]